MAVTVPTGTWYNSDGLLVKIGTAEAKISRGGELGETSTRRVITFNLKLTDLTASPQVINTGISIPKGSLIDKVTTISETAATGSTATLNVGTVGHDWTTGQADTALLAAQALSTLSTAGTETATTVGGTYAGTALGVATTASGFITAKYATAAFTAGEVRVIVEFYVPAPAASN